MRFFGQYLQRLDQKHRAVVPRRYRELIGEQELRNGLVLTRGFDDCLFLFPASLWEEMAEKLSAEHFMTFKARMLQRLLFSQAVEVVPDKVGRVMVPEHLRKVAGLEGEALFVGASNRIELWSPQRWAALTEAHDAQFEELAEEMYRLLQGREST